MDYAQHLQELEESQYEERGELVEEDYQDEGDND